MPQRTTGGTTLRQNSGRSKRTNHSPFSSYSCSRAAKTTSWPLHDPVTGYKIIHAGTQVAEVLLKQGNLYQFTLTCLCFGSPTVQLVSQHVWFCTMWLDRAKGPIEESRSTTQVTSSRDKRYLVLSLYLTTMNNNLFSQYLGVPPKTVRSLYYFWSEMWIVVISVCSLWLPLQFNWKREK